MARIRTQIKKNDMVMVTKGREKGKSGKVLRVLTEKQTVVVEKLNFIKRHVRPSQQMRQGGIVEKEAPISIANLMILCPKCNKPVRIGKKRLEDGKKARVCAKCGDVLDK